MSRDLSNASRQISQHWSEAQGEWEHVRETWRDSNGAAFERNFWAELERTVPRYIDALHELMAAIRESQQKIPD